MTILKRKKKYIEPKAVLSCLIVIFSNFDYLYNREGSINRRSDNYARELWRIYTHNVLRLIKKLGYFVYNKLPDQYL